jgi:hypothetical protein
LAARFWGSQSLRFLGKLAISTGEMEMNRMFIAGAATALTVCAAAWGGLQYTQPAKAAADGTLGMALMSANVTANGFITDGTGTGVVSAMRTGIGQFQVVFERDVYKCTYAANIASSNDYVSQGSIAATNTPSARNTVKIATWLPNQYPTDLNFHLLVFCPR